MDKTISESVVDRKFMVDTPLGTLIASAKHEGKDSPEDYPGIFIDWKDSFGDTHPLVCVEFNPTTNEMQSQPFHEPFGEGPGDMVVFDYVIPCEERLDRWISNLEDDEETPETLRAELVRRNTPDSCNRGDNPFDEIPTSAIPAIIEYWERTNGAPPKKKEYRFFAEIIVSADSEDDAIRLAKEKARESSVWKESKS